MASSILPRLTDAHAESNKKIPTNLNLMFSIIIYLPFGGNSFYNIKKQPGERDMAISVQNFIKLANFYNQLATTMSAICVQKGGIPLENYVGRFFAADVLEFVSEYGRRLVAAKTPGLTPEVVAIINQFNAQYERVRGLVTPTQKPIYEMTLEEFEKIMNI